MNPMLFFLSGIVVIIIVVMFVFGFGFGWFDLINPTDKGKIYACGFGVWHDPNDRGYQECLIEQMKKEFYSKP